MAHAPAAHARLTAVRISRTLTDPGQVADLERQLADAAGDRRHREAEARARSARFLTETLDAETVGRRIIESVCALFEVTAAGLRLREPDGSLVLVGAASDDGPYMPVGHRAPPGFGFYRLVVDSGQARSRACARTRARGRSRWTSPRCWPPSTRASAERTADGSGVGYHPRQTEPPGRSRHADQRSH